ncbi:MMPL family transporter [Solirubrobacter soli]|uniref:MMPL family transporter n=1 Tax=Solirubrobacter soli TaxID=363832 RepID=UPI000411703C|nr:MMPL family transporter [Solirubrobacter soli]
MIALWLVAAVVAFPFQSKLQALASDESDAFQDSKAESVKVNDTIERAFAGGGETTALVLYTKNGQLQPEDFDQVTRDGAALCEKGRIPDVVRVITRQNLSCGELPQITYQPSSTIKPFSDDQTSQISTIWTSDDATETVVRDVAAIRAAIKPPPGVKAYVTGEAAFAADQSKALEGIDQTLLIVTLALVLFLLLAIYRNPFIAVVPLIVVGIAYVVAAGVVYAGAKAGLYRPTGQATAILIVLMFGAGTDYCLLLLARYREELAAGSPDPMGTAVRRTMPTIVSAGGIVAGVMLVLTVADYNATRWMGPVLAIGIAVTVLAGITLLPAILSVLPKTAFRAGKSSGMWPRIGALVRERPGMLIAAVLAVLVAGALGNLKDREPLDFAEQFRSQPESVAGLRVMQAKFPPGQSGPVDIVIDQGVLSTKLPQLGSDVAYSVDLVGYSKDAKRALVRVTLDGDPFTERATEAVTKLRENAKAISPTAMVGGATAEVMDAEAALRRDARLIVPLALILVFVIIAALLRSLIAPIYVILTVVLSYAFALGVSSIVFGKSDPAEPLFTFLFLVALGVDYNVFLLTRIKEARRNLSHEDAVIKGLELTGGVITSAGLILAGTFCTLLATELQSLYQVGFTVALGLLVDTFLIRIFLVPSIALRLGPKAL